MADNDHIDADEFRTLRLLHSDERATVDRTVARRLASKRLVTQTMQGWSLTVAGRAEHLCELIRAFDGFRTKDQELAGRR